jgi:DNA-binding FadR family transcriptional regulator
LLDELLDDMRRTVESGGDPLTVNQNDVDFHAEIYAASDNICLQALWESLSRHVVIVFALETFERLEPARNLRQHEILRDLLVKGDLTALDVEIESHIMSYLPPHERLERKVLRDRN